MTTPQTQTKPASEKQLGLITKLAGERGFDLTGIDTASLTGGRNGSASALITSLFGMPRVDGQGTTKVDPDPGFYRVGDDIVQVRISKSGNWYAQLAVKVPGRKSLKWDYLGKRIDMATAVKMSEAEAGRFYGYCMMCGALLEDPDSIERGIGPVCAKKV
jgi:hypothetical protein